MSTPNPQHLEQRARGAAAREVLERLDVFFAQEREQTEREIERQMKEGSLTGEAALVACVRIAQLRSFTQRLLREVAAGDTASRSLAAAMTPPPGPNPWPHA